MNDNNTLTRRNFLKNTTATTAGIVLANGLNLVSSAHATNDAELKMVLNDGGFSNMTIARIETNDAKVSKADSVLRLEFEPTNDCTWIALHAPEEGWDLSAFTSVSVTLKNIGTTPSTLYCRFAKLGEPGADGQPNYYGQSIELPPDWQGTFEVPLLRKPADHLRGKFIGMRGLPDQMDEQNGIDAHKVAMLFFYLSPSAENHQFEISGIHARGDATPSLPKDEGRIFPMVDPFGQYAHKDWPGKIKSLDDLFARKQEETMDLQTHRGPDAWNQYGGWEGGPKLTSTGFFRVEKYQGRWWFVDPEGRLFWSHGPCSVNVNGGTTPISDREAWFAELPYDDPSLAKFFVHEDKTTPCGYYRDRAFDSYNFTAANIVRKYGEDWRETYKTLVHRRLRSWGMNTLANWSSSELCQMHKTPYVAHIAIHAKPILGADSSGLWIRFVDVFDPDFPEAARRAMAAQKGVSAEDPWCIGFFVDNELNWGHDLSLAEGVLRSPPEQAAKGVFIDDLKARYETVERLNTAWETRHSSWDALLQCTTPPEKNRARKDLEAFCIRIAERYFDVCRTVVKEVAPHQLYLGCRFALGDEEVVRAASKYCDVVSFNQYRHGVAQLRLPDNADKPILIGEFTFGALDRGMLHAGPILTISQQERAAAYRSYMRGALQNPNLVGAHWFVFGDEPVCGRFDGENYQEGLLDVCDTPYLEMIHACREVMYHMYQDRDENRFSAEPIYPRLPIVESMRRRPGRCDLR